MNPGTIKQRCEVALDCQDERSEKFFTLRFDGTQIKISGKGLPKKYKLEQFKSIKSNTSQETCVNIVVGEIGIQTLISS